MVYLEGSLQLKEEENGTKHKVAKSIAGKILSSVKRVFKNFPQKGNQPLDTEINERFFKAIISRMECTDMREKGLYCFYGPMLLTTKDLGFSYLRQKDDTKALQKGLLASVFLFMESRNSGSFMVISHEHAFASPLSKVTFTSPKNVHILRIDSRIVPWLSKGTMTYYNGGLSDTTVQVFMRGDRCLSVFHSEDERPILRWNTPVIALEREIEKDVLPYSCLLHVACMPNDFEILRFFGIRVQGKQDTSVDWTDSNLIRRMVKNTLSSRRWTGYEMCD